MINWDKHLEEPKFMKEIKKDNEEEINNTFKIGDRVRVLYVEEMLELNAELIQDKFGEYVQFYDNNDEGIHDAIFPITDEYLSLEGKLFTISLISPSGKIDLLEDEIVGYAVTKEMIRRVEDII